MNFQLSNILSDLFQVQGFTFDYLAKVPEVKDTVHKHSLLHHLCTIIIEQFSDATDLYSEIGAINRCAKVGSIKDSLAVTKLYKVVCMFVNIFSES